MKSEAKFKSDIRRYVRSIVEQNETPALQRDAESFLEKLNAMAATLAPSYRNINNASEIKDIVVAVLKQFRAADDQKISGLNQAIVQLKKENQPSTPDEKVITENKRALFLAGIITEAQYRK